MCAFMMGSCFMGRAQLHYGYSFFIQPLPPSISGSPSHLPKSCLPVSCPLFLFCSLFILWGCHLRETMQPVDFCVWLTSCRCWSQCALTFLLALAGNLRSLEAHSGTLVSLSLVLLGFTACSLHCQGE